MAGDDAENAPFLGGAPASKAYEKATNLPSRVPSALRNPRYIKIAAGLSLVIAFFIFLANSFGDSVAKYFHRGSGNREDFGVQPRLHVLLPASQKNVDFCRTTLGLTALGYPDPVLLGWEDKFEKPSKTNPGEDITTKITKVYEYLESLPKERNKDVVVVADAYNSIFQLKHNTLIDRFFRVNRHANGRLIRRLGRRAINQENIKQKIIFGSAKTCTPNQIQSVACYPLPFGPVPMNLYGPNTDTIIGENKHSSFRPRYLDSGIIIGSVKPMRAMFKSAQSLVETMPKDPSWDNGSKTSSNLYGGSAQAIFNIVFGRQEYQREIIRQRHRTFFKKISPKHVPGSVESTHYKDIINPPFTHEKWQKFDGHPYEFGIGVDYWSELEHNTMFSTSDAQFLNYSDPTSLRDQLNDRNDFDCGPARLPRQLPEDIALSSSTPFSDSIQGNYGATRSMAQDWKDLSLYTQVCLGSVPVKVQFNDIHDSKQAVWENMWYRTFAKEMIKSRELPQAGTLDEYKAAADGECHGGLWTDKGKFKTWDSVCKDFDKELFPAE